MNLNYFFLTNYVIILLVKGKKKGGHIARRAIAYRVSRNLPRNTGAGKYRRATACMVKR